MSKFVVAYIPVLHSGYKEFLTKHKDAECVYVFGSEIIEHFRYLKKEIRELDAKDTKKAIESWKIVKKVEILTTKDLKKLNLPTNTIIIPNEDVTLELSQSHFDKAHVLLDDIFLRWDRHRATKEMPVDIDQHISKEGFDVKVVKRLAQYSEEKSSDWWRQVGAALFKDDLLLVEAYNKHVPSDHNPYAFGDPRNAFSKGIHIDKSTALHAEAGIISHAAKQGIKVEGCSMYVSTFPCPPCAKLIAYSGIKKLYYSGGYSVLDSDSVLKSQGVEIIFVDTKGGTSGKYKK